MMAKLIHFLLLILIVSSAAGESADEMAIYTVPVDWQRVELQKIMEDKLNESIEAVIEKPKFLVHVNVRLSASKTFGVDQGKGKESEAFPLAKLGINKESAAYKKAITSGSETVFNRLAGINVTLSLDQTVTAAQEQMARELIGNVTQSYGGGRVEVKTRRLRFIGDVYQRSRNLEVARVNVEAAKSIGEAIAKSNAQIADAINAFAGREPTQVKEEKEETKTPEAVEKPLELPKTWQEALMIFKLPISILAATLLLLIFVSGFKTIESQKVAVMAAAANQAKAAAENQNTRVAKDEDQERESSGGETLALKEGGGAGSADSGFEQFKRLATEAPDTAAYLIKLWLNMETPESQRAVASLTKMVPVETLVPVISGLDDELKLKLKKASLVGVDAAAIQRAEGFIVEQMVENFLVNTVELPEDLKTLLSSMTVAECVECIKRDRTLGGVFANILQAAQVGRILKQLPADEVSGVLEEGLNFSASSVDSLGSSIRSLLSEIRDKGTRNKVPLVTKGLELIRFLGPEREGEVFKMLIASGATEQILEATKRYYPAELLLTLPADKLRVLLSKMPTNQRAALIYTREEGDKKLMLEAIGAQGRLRDIINDEFREIEKNATLKMQIQKDQAKYWLEFVQVARETIRNDERIKETADELLKKWLSSRGVDTTGGVDGQAA